MNSDMRHEFRGCGAWIGERSRNLKGQVVRLAVILLVAATAYAQYGGGGGMAGGTTTGTSSGTYAPGTPSYGHGKAIGIGVGAAAAGVGAVYILTHRSSTITGCTEMSDDGLRLTDEKTKRTLAILPGPADVRPGQRMELKGKIKKSAAGSQNFLVKKVAKDFGECHAQAGSGAPIPAGSQGR